MQYKQSKYNLVIEKNEGYVLLFNSNSGSLLELSVDEYRNFCKNTLSDEDKKTFIKQGFIIPKDINEYNQILFNETKLIYENNNKLIFVIAPTLKCNMRCYYCFENNKNTANTMSIETENEVISFIKKTVNQNNNVKELMISWFGGEPTLCFGTIKRISEAIIEFAKENNLKYSAVMMTNGYLLDLKKAEELVKFNVRKIQITLDGSQDYYCKVKNVLPNVYNTVISNIHEIHKLFKLTIRLNFALDNLNSLIDLVKEFDDCEQISFYLAPIKNHNHIFEDEKDICVEDAEFQNKKEILYSIIPKNKLANDLNCGISPIGVSCGLMKSKNQVIGPDGELYYCEHDLGISSRIIGDVRNGIYFNEYFMGKLHPIHLEKCRDCKIFPLCLTGCQSEVEQFSRPNEYCETKVKSLFKYLKKIYHKEANI